MNNYNEIVSKVYNQFLSRNPDISGSRVYSSLLSMGKLSLKDFVITITNSNEYVEKSRVNINKIFKRLLTRKLNDREFKIYFEILKRNGNRIEVIENIIKNSHEYKQRQTEQERRLLLNQQKQQSHKKNLANMIANKRTEECSSKIKTLFKDILEREIDSKSLNNYIEKVHNKRMTYEEIEYELLNSEECSKLIDNKISQWINKVDD